METSNDYNNYRCQHENDNGECTHEYEGYGCIKDRCHMYGTMMVRIGSDEKLCSYKQDNYCTRFKKFHCPGAESCHSFNL